MKQYTTSEIIDALRAMSNEGFVLTGQACGVLVNPLLLTVAADRLEELAGKGGDG